MKITSRGCTKHVHDPICPSSKNQALLRKLCSESGRSIDGKAFHRTRATYARSMMEETDQRRAIGNPGRLREVWKRDILRIPSIWQNGEPLPFMVAHLPLM